MVVLFSLLSEFGSWVKSFTLNERSFHLLYNVLNVFLLKDNIHKL